MSKEISKKQLCDIAERILSLENSKIEIDDAIEDIYLEAKTKGANTRVLRQLISELKKS